MKKYKPRKFESGMPDVVINLTTQGEWADDRVVMIVRDGKLLVKSTHRNDRNVMTVPVQKGQFISFTLTQRELVRMKTLYGDVSSLLMPGNRYHISSGKRGWLCLGPEGDHGMAHITSPTSADTAEDIREMVIETPVSVPPVCETPVCETPVCETPVNETPVCETPVYKTPVCETPVTE